MYYSFLHYSIGGVFLITTLNYKPWRYTNADFKISLYFRVHIKNSTNQIFHYNTFHFLRYSYFRYAKCLFTNIQKHRIQSNLLFKKITNFTGN